MKRALKFAGLCAAVLALVAFIILLTAHGINYAFPESFLLSGAGWYSGQAVLFGKGAAYASATIAGIGGGTTGTFEGKGAVIALVAWILIIVAVVALLAGVILPMLKVKGAEKVAGVLNLLAALLLVVAGVMLFFTVKSFTGANEVNKDAVKYYHLGGGWVVAAIFSIAAGVFSMVPACVDFVSKRK